MSLAAEHRKLALWVANGFHAPDRAGIESAALLGLVRAEADFAPDRGSFAALAVLSCRHAASREVRRQRRRAEREEPLYFTGADGEEEERRDLPHAPAPDADVPLMVGRLREVLAELPPRTREVISRRFGLAGPEESLAAIASEFGVDRGTVKRLETRALVRLRAALSRRHRGPWAPGPGSTT